MTKLDEELERLLSPQYLEGLHDRPIEEVRVMRAECQGAESKLSLLRRSAQGALDILHGYIDRRSRTDDAELPSVEELAAILASGPESGAPRGLPRMAVSLLPEANPEDLTLELDDVLGAERIASLPSLNEDELTAVADELTAHEKRISAQRRALHEIIDRLQAEIVSRYKTGEATVESLLR